MIRSPCAFEQRETLIEQERTTSNNTPLVQKEILRTHDSYQNSVRMFSFYHIKINGKTEKQMENTCVGVLLYYKDTPRARTIFIEHLQVIFSHITKVAAGIL